ncbi:MAG TPA: ubiquinol-cytochrome c reductase iron-sulfur subunit [Steroidobacteraceae bacterium]|nr:ubiquinol-cytochrome c reductase iron-sulfur subunit [Steroidobacteraceae bacterium]
MLEHRRSILLTMTAATIDNERRKLLLRGTSSLAVGAAALTAMPFLASWQPSEATRLGGQPIRIDLTKLSEGEGLELLWRGSPMWVVRRSAATVAKLQSQRDLLKDPDSLESTQPAYANNAYRSARPDMLVLTAICTHLGCVPQLKMSSDDQLGADLEAGFYCPCHGSRFDLAGRVVKGSPAPRNLPVPAYHLDERTLVIGAESDAAG